MDEKNMDWELTEYETVTVSCQFGVCGGHEDAVKHLKEMFAGYAQRTPESWGLIRANVTSRKTTKMRRPR